MTSKSDTTITVITNDEVEIKIAKKYCMQIGLLKDILEEDIDDDHNIQIPLPNAGSKEFLKIKEYVEHHFENEAAIIEKPIKGMIKDNVSKWDADFLDSIGEDPEVLTPLLSAA